jgi:hypothetical protein
MGVFEFIIALVIISSAAKIIGSRRRSLPLPRESFQLDAEELHRIRDTIAELGTRLERLEEERDFYKDLLEPPPNRSTLPPPGSDS